MEDEKKTELDRFEQRVARRRKRIALDLAVIGVAVIAIAFAANRFDFFNLLTAWVRAHEPTPIDDILTILIALSFFGGIFSYRRWLDLRSEIRARERTERALRLLGAELETRVEARTADLRAAESRTKLLMESADIGLWDWDLLTNEVVFSPEWKRQLGYSDSALGIGYEEWESRLHPDDRERALDSVKGYLEGRRATYDVEFRLRHKNGSWRWLLARAETMRDASGKPLRLMGCHVDITDLKETQESLRQSETRYRDIFNASPLPKWIFRLPDLKILDVNQAAIEHYGYSSEEFRALTLLDVRPKEEVARLRETIRADGDRPAKGSAGTWKHRKKDGTLIDVEVYTHPVVIRGEELQLAVILDVTDRLRLEEQYRHAQKMEAIARLAGGIAHDFNNLLMVVQGIADVLPLHAGDETATAKDLGNLRMISERGGALTRQLLAFSRQHVLQTEVVDVGKLVSDLSPMIERLIGADIRLTIRAAPDSGPVCMDPSQMEQIVMNLVVNARDAMPSGGRLSIEVSSVTLDPGHPSTHRGVEPGKYTVIAVTDSGVGMSAEVRKNIFEPFFTTKEQGKGTGLGLATVYGIVKSLKGHVRVHSEPTRGSVFEVYLPLEEGKGSARRSSSEAAAVSGPGDETIFVVEDEATIREMAESFLSGIGYRVISAADGSKALEMLASEKGRIHLVVTDVVLPGHGGQEVATAAVARDPNTRVIFMSGYTDDAEIQKSVAFEGFDFLQKPFPLKALASRIRAALDRVA